MFERLLELGIRPLKAKRIRVPTIPSQYVSDFIRGYFDGDGGVCYYNSHKRGRRHPTRMLITTFTSASRGMLKDIATFLYKMADMRLKTPTEKKDNSYELRYSTNDSRKIYHFLYRKASTLYLQRKKIVFEAYMRA